MSAITQLSAALASRYEIEREIGAGGMATVYLARDVRHQISSSGATGPNNGATGPMWTGGGRLMFRAGGVVRSASLDFGGAVPRVVRIDSLFSPAVAFTGLPGYGSNYGMGRA